jgi:cytochrome c oxidase assembly protein subunit 15
MAKITMVATFILLLAGALVTGNKAAMSDPTWPQFVGHWFPRYFQGGLKYEDSHRIIAATVGFLTLFLAIIIQLKDPRRFMKKLGWWALALVIVQALFGGLIIRSMRNPFISMTHASIAQAFFCLTVAMVVFSSKAWFKDLTEPPVERESNIGYLKFMKFAVAIIYLQVIMGTGVRHSNDATDMFLPHLLAHIAGAFAVIFTVIWFNMRTWHVYRDVGPLRRTAIWAGALVLYQIAFGIMSIFANRDRLQAGVPDTWDVAVSTGHLLGGASLLALMFASMLRAHRLLDHTPPVHIQGKAYQSREVIP